jgi:hypothetical protein
VPLCVIYKEVDALDLPMLVLDRAVLCRTKRFVVREGEKPETRIGPVIDLERLDISFVKMQLNDRTRLMRQRLAKISVGLQQLRRLRFIWLWCFERQVPGLGIVQRFATVRRLFEMS